MNVPSVRELRAGLAPYAERCPLCAAPLRVLDGPPARIVGCPDADDLAQLARQAADAGVLDRSRRA